MKETLGKTIAFQHPNPNITGYTTTVLYPDIPTVLYPDVPTILYPNIPTVLFLCRKINTIFATAATQSQHFVEERIGQRKQRDERPNGNECKQRVRARACMARAQRKTDGQKAVKRVKNSKINSFDNVMV